jgi:hypothetical protein
MVAESDTDMGSLVSESGVSQTQQNGQRTDRKSTRHTAAASCRFHSMRDFDSIFPGLFIIACGIALLGLVFIGEVMT